MKSNAETIAEHAVFEQGKVKDITAVIRASGLTPVGLKDLLLKVAEGPASPRIKVVLDGLCNLPLTEGRKLLTQTVTDAKPKDKAARRTDRVFRTLQVRVSECRQLYGAVKLVEGFRQKVADIGWHDSIMQAREALEIRNIKADGGPILTKEQVAAKREGSAIKEQLAEQLVGVNVNDEAAMHAAASRAVTAARDGMQASKIKAHAERIIKADGHAYALTLADYIIAWEPAEVKQPEQAEPEQVQQVA